MKKGMLLLLVLSSFFANAQSLKEALYGGKLKNEPGSVIRKGDDLASKMDTARKANIDSAVVKTAVSTGDNNHKASNTTISSTVAATKDTVTGLADAAVATEGAAIPKEGTAAPKDNNAALKDFVTAVTNTLKAEVLSSKKIKSGTYYVSLSYAIGTDGQLAINNVLLTPENSYLQQQIKDRLLVDTPKLTPVLSSNGAPRKVSKNYNFTLVKE